jgi:excisionase family DNA binding protein
MSSTVDQSAFGIVLQSYLDDDEFKRKVAQVVNEILDARKERVPPVSASQWMTVQEAADFLRCPRSYIYDGRSNGRFTPHKRGSRALLDRTEIEAHAAGCAYPGREVAQ